MSKIHPTAIVDKNAIIGKDVTIGPFSWIQEEVEIGDGCEIGASVVICPKTTIGKECKILHHAAIGEFPQDLKFHGEVTSTEIGDRTTIREFVTIHRGTEDRWKTVVGSDCLLMAYAHVAHDCIVGNKVILANNVNLAGHVVVEDYAILGGMVGIHQFVHVGQHALIAGGFRSTKDIPPYIIAAGEPVSFQGLNKVGLTRRNFSKEVINEIKKAYQLILRSKHNVSGAIKILEQKGDLIPEVNNIINFIKTSSRGIIR